MSKIEGEGRKRIDDQERSRPARPITCKPAIPAVWHGLLAQLPPASCSKVNLEFWTDAEAVNLRAQWCGNGTQEAGRVAGSNVVLDNIGEKMWDSEEHRRVAALHAE